MPPVSTGKQASGKLNGAPKSKSALTGSGGGGGANGTKTGTGKEVKKLGSLSSFQATLNFAPAPSPSQASASSSSSLRSSHSTKTSISASSTSAATQRSTNGSSSSSLGVKREFARTASSDARSMPPPPLPVKTFGSSSSTSIRSSQIVGTHSNGSRSNASSSLGGKGKGKAVEVEIDDDDEDEIAVLGSGKPAAPSSGMWADMHGPTTISELAPGKARVATLREWMHLAVYGHPPDAVPISAIGGQREKDRIRKYKRLLFVTGPAGVGKTTAVRVVAREMGVELVEWGEGVEEWSLGSGGYDRESPMTKLTTFLSRHEYAPLSLSGSSVAARSPSQQTPSRPRVLLITALPNISHAGTREGFHSALSQFCKTYAPTSCPLIVVHSDVGSRGAAEESWRDRDRGGREGVLEVLGREVMEGAYLTQLSFLPIAPTFMLKAIRRVLELARQTHDFDPPPATALQLMALTSNGDLRSALNSIQLYCTHSNVKGKSGASASTKGGKRKAGGKGSDTGGSKKIAVLGKDARGWVSSKLDVPKDIRAVLDALTRKEQNLNLFHALGKVFYNKRLGDAGQANEDHETIAYVKSLPPFDPLPRHLKAHERSRSFVQMDDFIGSIPLDASSFALWLHQSAPTFCSEVEEAGAVLDELGGADIMRTDGDMWQSSTQAISYALHLSIGGVQMGLPSPVPRKHQKILKPQFFQAHKDQKANTDLVDTAAAYITRKAVSASCVLAERDLDDKQREGTIGVWGGMIPQDTLAVEVLPMMVKMQDMTTRPLLPASVAPLRLPPWSLSAASGRGEELTATQDVEGAEQQQDEGDEGAVMDRKNHGWDIEEEEEELKEGVKGWLEDDDIEDWD